MFVLSYFEVGVTWFDMLLSNAVYSYICVQIKCLLGRVEYEYILDVNRLPVGLSE